MDDEPIEQYFSDELTRLSSFGTYWNFWNFLIVSNTINRRHSKASTANRDAQGFLHSIWNIEGSVHINSSTNGWFQLFQAKSFGDSMPQVEVFHLTSCPEE